MSVCFRCAQPITTLWDYMPAYVVEVLADTNDEHCHCAVVCWACMCVIDPDLWLSAKYWDAASPAVRFEALPIYDHDAENRDEIETYTAFEPTQRGHDE